MIMKEIRLEKKFLTIFVKKINTWRLTLEMISGTKIPSSYDEDYNTLTVSTARG